MDVDLELGPAANQRAGRPRVVEVDVGEEQGLGLLAAQRLEQRLLARLWAGVDQHPVQREAGDDLLSAPVTEVDLPHRPLRLRQNESQ